MLSYLAALIVASAAISLYLLYRATTQSPAFGTRLVRAAVAIVSIAVVLRSFGTFAGNIVAGTASPAWSMEHSMFLKGARIVDAWTSPSYCPSNVDLYPVKMHNPHVDELVRQSYGPVSGPEVTIGLYADRRALWFFAGQHATLAVALPEPVLIEGIRLRGNSDERCHPRDVNVWGLVLRATSYNITPAMLNWPPTGFPAQLHKRTSIGYGAFWGAFMGPFPDWIPLAQLRDIPLGKRDNNYAIEQIVTEHGIGVHAIALEFIRNWGNDYSCFPGLGISGSVA